MSEPSLPLWTRDNSDVLPEYQLTFGHALFRLRVGDEWQGRFSRELGLGKLAYAGPLQPRRIPRHQKGCLMLGTSEEIHIVMARAGSVWAIFGPHDLFFASRKWMDFNRKAGGLMAFVTQMDIESYSYLVFENGIKQTNAFAENVLIRVVPDTQITAFVGGEKFFEDTSSCSLSDADIKAFVEEDLKLDVQRDEVEVKVRFPNQCRTVDEVVHSIYQRGSSKRSLFGISFWL